MYKEYEYEELEERINVDAVTDSYLGGVGFEAPPPQGMFGNAGQQVDYEQHRAAIESIPEQVREFLHNLHRSIKHRNVGSINSMYEHHLNKITETFYAKSSWPDPQFVYHLIKDDEFILLYREIYYRHIYSRLQPTIQERFQSYENYCLLFNYILNSDGPVSLELPNKWMWDIIDEFIYQYRTFCTYRSRLASKTPEELDLLRNSPEVWSTLDVLNVMYSLVSRSNIKQQLHVGQHGGDLVAAAGEYGSCTLYKMLGYFSLAGLLRVNCLLGDYTLALQSLENFELKNHRAMFTRVTACHVSVFYYVGVSYLMMRRYADAIRIFETILTFITRTRQYQARLSQFDEVNKKADQMYALLALTLALSPCNIDDQVYRQMHDKYNDQYHRLLQGGEASLAVAQELFLYASPRFVSPNPPNYDDIESPQCDLQMFQFRLFLKDVRLQFTVPNLRSILKLYSALSIEKMAAFADMDVAQLEAQLIVYKQRCRQARWLGGPDLLASELAQVTDLDFAIVRDLICVAESKRSRQFSNWYITSANRLQEIVNHAESQLASKISQDSRKSDAQSAAAVPN